MPISAVMGPRDLPAGQFSGLSCKTDGAFELALKNLFENASCIELSPSGDPVGMPIAVPDEPYGRNWYLSEPGIGTKPPDPSTLEQQNGDALALNRPGFLYSQERYTGDRPETNPRNAAALAKPPSPFITKILKALVGYKAGVYYLAFTYVLGGRHTTLSAPVRFEILGNGRAFIVALPPEVPDGVEAVGIWLSLPAAPNAEPNFSTMRLQREVPVGERTYRMTGPWRAVRRPPTLNETYLGRAPAPDANLEAGAGNLASGAWAFGVTIVTPYGQTALGILTRERRIPTTTRTETVVTDNGDGTRTTTRTRTVLPYTRNKSFHVRPNGAYPHARGFRVWARRDGVYYVCFNINSPAGAEAYTAFKEAAQRKGKPLVEGDRDDLREVIVYGEPEEGATGQRWVAVQMDPPLEDTSGIPAPEGQPDAPVVDPTTPATLGPGTYLVAMDEEMDDGRKSLVSDPVRITLPDAGVEAGQAATGTTQWVIYAAHRDPVNEILNAQVREWLSPTPNVAGEELPTGWRGLWVDQNGVEAVPTLAQGRSYRTDGTPSISTDGPAGFSGSTNVHTRAVEPDYDIPVVRDRDTWIAGTLSGEVLGGEARLELHEKNAAGATINVRHLATMVPGSPDQPFEVLYGPNGSAWNPAAVSGKPRLVFAKTGGVVGSVVNGSVGIQDLLWSPMRGRPPRYVTTPAPIGKPNDPNPFPEDPYPSYAARIVAPPRAVKGRANASYLALANFESGTLAAPGIVFARTADGAATTNAQLVSEVAAASRIDGDYGWRVEDNGTAFRGAVYALHAPDAPRSSMGARAKFRVRQLPTRAQVMLFNFNSPTLGSFVTLYLTPQGQINMYTRFFGVTIASGIGVGDVVDLEPVLTGAGGAAGRLFVLMGKNGATRTQIAFYAGQNFVNQTISSAQAGLVYETDPASTCKLDFDSISFTPFGDSLGTPGSLGGRALPRPDRPEAEAATLARLGFEPAEGDAPAGWAFVGGGTSSYFADAPIAGSRSLRLSNLGPGAQRYLDRTFRPKDPSSFAVKHRFRLRSSPTSGECGLAAVETPDGRRLATFFARAGRYVCDVRHADGTLAQTLDVGPAAADAGRVVTVELQAQGLGTPAGSLNVWLAPGTPGKEAKEVYGQQVALNWAGLSSGRAKVGAIAPTTSGWVVDLDDVHVTNGGETVFRENFRPLGASGVVDSLSFSDGTTGDWALTHAPRNLLSTQIVTGQAALGDNDQGWRIRDDDEAQGSRIFLSKSYPTGSGDLLGVRLLVNPNLFPTHGFVAIARLADDAGAELGRIEAGEHELRMVAPRPGGAEETRFLIPVPTSGEAFEAELLAIDVGSADGTLWGSARRLGSEGRYVSESLGLNWTDRSARGVDFGAVSFTSPASRWQFDFDRVDVLRREETAPLPIRQVGFFIPAGSPVAADEWAQMRFVVLPGLTYKAGLFARWLRPNDAAPSFPFWITLHDDAGRVIEVGSPFGGGTAGNPAMNGITGDPGGWKHYETQAFTVPDGFFELRVRCKDMGEMYFLHQEFALSPGSAVDRSPGRALRGSFDSHLDMRTPMEEAGVYGEWRGLESGVVSAPDGAAHSSTFRTSNDPARLAWSPSEKDPEIVPPGNVAHLHVELYGDGSATPRVSPGGPKVAYRKMEGTMTREDRSEIPGGVIVKKVQFPTYVPDFEGDWTEGGNLQVLPATPPLGRIDPFTVYTFTEEGARELRETSAGGVFWLEVRGQLVKIRFKDAVPMMIKPETEVTIDGQVYHVWGEGQTSVAQVLEEGRMP